MARLIKCDRCGVYVDVQTPEYLLPTGWVRVEGCDLCPNCVNAMHDFLRGVKLMGEGQITVDGDKIAAIQAVEAIYGNRP